MSIWQPLPVILRRCLCQIISCREQINRSNLSFVCILSMTSMACISTDHQAGADHSQHSMTIVYVLTCVHDRFICKCLSGKVLQEDVEIDHLSEQALLKDRMYLCCLECHPKRCNPPGLHWPPGPQLGSQHAQHPPATLFLGH